MVCSAWPGNLTFSQWLIKGVMSPAEIRLCTVSQGAYGTGFFDVRLDTEALGAQLQPADGDLYVPYIGWLIQMFASLGKRKD